MSDVVRTMTEAGPRNDLRNGAGPASWPAIITDGDLRRRLAGAGMTCCP